MRTAACQLILPVPVLVSAVAWGAAVVALGGCGKRADDAPAAKATAAPTAPGGAYAGLTVTVAGKRIPIDRAFITRTSPDAYVLQLGHLQGSCDELMGGAAATSPGGTTFSLSLARQVQPTGHAKLVVTDFWSRSLPTKPTLGGTAALSAEPTPGVFVTVELPQIVDLAAPRTDATVEVTGAVAALGCGDTVVTGLGVPKTTHKSNATITVAGKQLPIRGVILNPPDIVISTGPKDCSAVTVAAPVVLERVRGQWGLRGTWFAQPVQNTALPDEATRELQFGAKGVGTSLDGPVIELELSGAGKVGDYAVKLEGIADAIECVAGR
ncbi:MAG: hypothetical protein M3680_06840 [Myxococcota bacterium]|nr:hypothetical protein [Myxococcota bacterium]